MAHEKAEFHTKEILALHERIKCVEHELKVSLDESAGMRRTLTAMEHAGKAAIARASAGEAAAARSGEEALDLGRQLLFAKEECENLRAAVLVSLPSCEDQVPTYFILLPIRIMSSP